MTISANEILDDHDPESIKNILYWLRQDLDELLNPAPTEIINDFPDGFPPTSINTKTGLKWFIVTDYGAVGDGAADDTIAINNTIAALNDAGRGVLYFPAGSYLCSSALTTITASALVIGDGVTSHDSSVYSTKVLCSSATAILFTVSALYGRMQDIAFVNTAGSTPSAGAGVKVTNGSSSYFQRIDFFNVRITGFYIGIDIDYAGEWIVDNCAIKSPVLYGLRYSNSASTDRGGWTIANSHFRASAYNATAGIYIGNNGLSDGKIVNCLINYDQDGSGTFEQGIISANTLLYGHLVIANNLIANLRGHGIQISGGSRYINIVSNSFGLSYFTGNNTGNCINLSGVSGVVIADNIFVGGGTPAAISLSTVAGAKIVGNYNSTFSSLVSQSGCSNIVIVEPGASVTVETAYGQSSAVGTSGYYAREDHTHGSPSLSTAAPQEVGSSGSAGSGITPPKNDHVHKGVHSLAKFGGSALYGDVTISEGANITITPSGNDLEIATESAGQYRQFVYEVSGGDFSFVIDEDGNPVMALEDLE